MLVQASHSGRKRERNLTSPKPRKRTPNDIKNVPSKASVSLFKKPRVTSLTASMMASLNASVRPEKSLRRALSTIFLAKTDQPVEVSPHAFKTYMPNLWFHAAQCQNIDWHVLDVNDKCSARYERIIRVTSFQRFFDGSLFSSRTRRSRRS